MALPKNETRNTQPKLDENLSTVEENANWEKQVANGKLEQIEFDPTKNKLAKDYPELFSKNKGKETTKANPIIKKHPESGEIEDALASASQEQEAGKQKLEGNTRETKQRLVEVLPAIAPTVERVKAENEESKKGTFFDRVEGPPSLVGGKKPDELIV